MINPLLVAARWFSKRNLRTQILALVITSTAFSFLMVSYLSFSAGLRQAESEAIEQSQALAGMAARATASAMLERDYGSLELFLGELMTLPGVYSAELVHPGGEVAMRIRRTAEGHATLYPADENLSPPTEANVVQGMRLFSTAPLLQSSRPTAENLNAADMLQSGWVRIETHQDERHSAAVRQWLNHGLNTLIFLTGMLWLLATFLRRVFGPISALAAFPSTLAAKPGSTLRIRWGSHEVRELGRSMNNLSRQLVEKTKDHLLRFNRLRAILHTAADAIIGVDEHGRIVSANPAAERMLGLDATALVGKAISQWLPGMDTARLKQIMDDGTLYQSTQSRVGRIEMEAQRQDGTKFPVEVSLGEVAADPELRFTCIVRDLTDVKLAEEYMALYGRVVDCTLNGIMIADARRYPTPVVYVNPAFSRITEFAPHEILGRDPSQLNGEDTDPSDLKKLEHTIRNGGELSITMRQYRKSGAMFHNKLSVSPVRAEGGTITHFIYVLEDVSSQIEVKRRLIERTARLNATFDLSPDGFAVFDSSGHLISSNPSLRAMIGKIPSLCSIDQFDGWLRSLCERVESYRPVSEALKEPRTDILDISRPSPKVIEREIRRNLGGSGETFLYFRDVTHQKEVDRIKSEFLATAAHELRTPLASILGFTELMMHRKYSDEKRLDMLQTVHRQGTLLSNLIQELLDLSRIEARQGKDFQIEPYPIATLVQHAVESVKDARHGRTVQMGDIPEDLAVMADASKAQQCLINLISNAFKYSPDGGDVSLDVTEERRNDEDMVVVRIKDHGLGLTPVQLARVFERFYRADGSGNIPGTGLGLNLVKEIVEILGGTIELESEHGKGTTAVLCLRKADLPALTELPAG